MDLDDEELEATRKLNGVAKESDIEEDIKRCEQLIKPQHANWIGISNQFAIAHLIERIKELEEENYVQKIALLENSVPKQKVKDKIEELKEVRKIALERKMMSSVESFEITIGHLEELLEEK